MKRLVMKSTVVQHLKKSLLKKLIKTLCQLNLKRLAINLVLRLLLKLKEQDLERSMKSYYTRIYLYSAELKRSTMS